MFRRRCNCAEDGNGIHDLLPTFLSKLRAGTAQYVQRLRYGVDSEGAVFDSGLGMTIRFLSSQKLPDQLQGQPSLVVHGCLSRFPWR
jgi:hypothetical protein